MEDILDPVVLEHRSKIEAMELAWYFMTCSMVES
jgi:hypothetical protein